MTKEDFMAKQSTLNGKYVQILSKYFIDSINRELLNINHLAAFYDIDIHCSSVDYINDIYRSFNTKMQNDIILELRRHYDLKGWTCNFTVLRDSDSDRRWIVCHARFTI